MFSLDAMEDARMLETPARNVSLEEVDRELGAGYGIYRGRTLEWAELHFNPEAARWVRIRESGTRSRRASCWPTAATCSSCLTADPSNS